MELGELVHRGALVALGYWNDPEKTAARFRPAPGRAQGWRAPDMAVYSGDLVVADDEGFLYFVGRNDEMIKTSGYRVSPSEIEEVAYESGLVRDVVALGVEDALAGMPYLNEAMLVTLGKAGIKTLDDLADLEAVADGVGVGVVVPAASSTDRSGSRWLSAVEVGVGLTTTATCVGAAAGTGPVPGLRSASTTRTPTPCWR